MSARKDFPWARLSDEELLDTRICDLKIRLEDTPLPRRMERLHEELERKGLRFRPYCWLSNEWFTPDGCTGIAIPFYLAHPRLQRLEKAMVLDVEGGTEPWCMQLLRHECGHAIDNAFELRRRRKRTQTFGKSTTPYGDYYTARPYSRKYVRHLDSHYAQSHPDEDFAETFAVWLTPRSSWRKRYAGWGALKKLEYMDELMGELAGERPSRQTRTRDSSLAQLRMTLREHYEERRQYLGVGHPEYFQGDLRKLFSADEADSDNMTAAAFLRRVRRHVRRAVARTTGIFQYTIDQVLQDMLDEARRRKWWLRKSEEETMLEFTSMLTVVVMSYIQDEIHRIPR